MESKLFPLEFKVALPSKVILTEETPCSGKISFEVANKELQSVRDFSVSFSREFLLKEK